MEIKIRPELLHAFSQIVDGNRFTKNELHCRIMSAKTDEGYEIQDACNLEFYAIPSDPSWHEYMRDQYGNFEHDIIIYQTRWASEKTSASVELYIRSQLDEKLEQARLELQRLQSIVNLLDIE